MATATANLPALSSNLSPEGNLSRYLSDIRKFPLLEPQEEFMLAKRWREHGDSKAAHQLVTSHLRLVAKIAMGYRGYGLPVAELISEGNVGMMQAVKRFDPDRGFRLATYAMWWIRASIQEYILHSWSLVKMGTTAAQKKLFFNLRKLKGQMQAIDEGDLSDERVRSIAEKPTSSGVLASSTTASRRRCASRRTPFISLTRCCDFWSDRIASPARNSAEWSPRSGMNSNCARLSISTDSNRPDFFGSPRSSKSPHRCPSGPW